VAPHAARIRAPRLESADALRRLSGEFSPFLDDRSLHRVYPGRRWAQGYGPHCRCGCAEGARVSPALRCRRFSSSAQRLPLITL
jgi:hypothetical protein